MKHPASFPLIRRESIGASARRHPAGACLHGIVFILLALATVCAVLAAGPVPGGGGAAAEEQSAPGLEGVLSIVWGDPVKGSGGQPRMEAYVTPDDQPRVRQVWSEEGFDYGTLYSLIGKRVKVTGIQYGKVDGTAAGDTFYLDSLTSADISKKREISIASAQPWVTILLKFKSNASEPETISYFQNMFGNTYPQINHFWKELSYNNITIDGSYVAPKWYELPYPQTHYNTGDINVDLGNLFNDATAAADADIDFGNYVGINMFFNDNLDGHAWGGQWYATLDGQSKVWYATWEPPWGYQHIAPLQHEMGHGFGLPHSCFTEAATYDNSWDVMSNVWSNDTPDATYGTVGQHTIAYHKDLLGWIPSGQKVTVATGTKQTVTLERLAQPSNSNPKMVVAPIGGSATHFYTVEARKEVGYDGQLPGAAVIVHDVLTTRDIPAHVTGTDGGAGAMLTAGETYTDATNHITVTVNASTASGFTVEVNNNYVPAGPTITDQPDSQTINSGQTATLTVAATGTGTLSYQWYRGSSGSTANPVGTNASSFTTPALTTTTSYWVRVTDSNGTADSNTATVTICAAPSITSHPPDKAISSGQTTTLSVTANGTATLSYQWYRGSSGSTANPVGTNASSFTTPALTTTTSYWVRVTNGCGSADSHTATVTVTACAAPSITAQPQGTTIVSGGTATLTVAAEGTATLSYQWYRGNSGSTANPVGTNANSFTTPALTTTTSYWVRVTNGCGAADSSTATVTVGSCAAPSITDQPDSQTIVSGQTATLSVTASGTATLGYQWYRGNSGSTSNPVGTNANSFTTPALTTTTSYWVRVTNGCGTADSSTATVTVCNSPSITAQPQNGSVNAGQTRTLTVTASGAAPLSYQWYLGNSGSTANPVGTNANAYTPPPLFATTYFWVRVANGCGTADSTAARISVRCDADVNQDGAVNAQDLILLAQKLARCPAGDAIPPGEGDVNQDGQINALDLVVLALIVAGVS